MMKVRGGLRVGRGRLLGDLQGQDGRGKVLLLGVDLFHGRRLGLERVRGLSREEGLERRREDWIR